MSEAPSLIYNDSPGAIPATYKFPPALDARLSSVSAVFDGSGAGGAFLACLSVYSQDGKLIGRFFPGSSVAAGDTAEVTFAPFLDRTEAASAGGAGLQFNAGAYGPDNVGDWLVVETTDPTAQDFTEPSATRHDLSSGYGSGLNVNDGLLITSPPDSWFNSGNPVVEINQYDPTHDYGAFGLLIQAATKNGEAYGIQAFARGNGAGNVEAIIAQALTGASQTVGVYAVDANAINLGSGDTVGVFASGYVVGTGKEIGLKAQAAGGQSGANSLAILAVDSIGNHIFEVRNDGSVHIKTGTAVIADL